MRCQSQKNVVRLHLPPLKNRFWYFIITYILDTVKATGY